MEAIKATDVIEKILIWRTIVLRNIIENSIEDGYS